MTYVKYSMCCVCDSIRKYGTKEFRYLGDLAIVVKELYPNQISHGICSDKCLSKLDDIGDLVSK